MKGEQLRDIASVINVVWDSSLAHIADMKYVYLSGEGFLVVKSGFMSVRIPCPDLFVGTDASIDVAYFTKVFGNLDKDASYRIVRKDGKCVLQENGKNIVTFMDGNVVNVKMLMENVENAVEIDVFQGDVVKALEIVVDFAGMKEVVPFFRGVHFSDGRLIALDRYRLVDVYTGYNVEISIFENAVRKLVALFKERRVSSILLLNNVMRMIAEDGVIVDVLLLHRDDEKLRTVKQISFEGEGIIMRMTPEILERLSRICSWIDFARKIVFEFECNDNVLVVRGGGDINLLVDDSFPVQSSGNFKFSIWISEFVELLLKVLVADIVIKDSIVYVEGDDGKVQGYLVRVS